MLLNIVVTVLLAQSSYGQLLSNNRRNKQFQQLGFPLVQPEFGINPNVRVETIAGAVEAFAKDISISLWEKQILGNVIFSPLSLEAILGLLLLGTRGVTYELLKNALFFPENVTDASIHETFQYILGQLESTTGAEIDITSALFVQRGIPISGTYKQISQALYDANINDVDFKNSPSRATRHINQFINRATRGKISDILNAPLSPNTLMVAINTIYFNGPWQFPFSKQSTKVAPFDTGTQKKNVAMMQNVMKIPFVNRPDLGFDMISLPYLDSSISLYIVTPTASAGLSSLINVDGGLSLLSVDRLVNQMQTTLVDVTIPRMKLQFRHNFKSHMEDLGATTIFDQNRSNFGRMTTESGFALEDIIHDAIIEISESGTIATAATVVTLNRIKAQQFRADKPSVLFIRDNSNGIILFWGRVVDPSL